MSPRRVLTAALLVFAAAAVGFLLWRGGAAPAQEGSPPAAVQVPQVTAYYFHGKARCATCRRLEAYAQEAIQAGFAAELASQRLVWRSLDITEAENRHFVTDYQLYSQSVVLVDSGAVSPSRWRKLDRIWELVGDKGAYTAYVEEEVRAFLGGPR